MHPELLSQNCLSPNTQLSNSRNIRKVELGGGRPGVSHTEDKIQISQSRITDQNTSQMNPYQDVSMMRDPEPNN